MAVIQERTAPISVNDKIISIYKPLYTRNFSDFLIRKLQRKDKRRIANTFAAPDAQVLVVDDNLLNIKVAKGHLELYGMQVDTATSGAEAIEKIKQKGYNLVFMDHMMPDMDGIEAYRRICLIDEDYIETMPVVALTANTDEEAIELFRTEGFQDFMPKPIQSDYLRDILLKWLPKDLIVDKTENDQ